VTSIESAVDGAALRPGAPLPSVRSLAGDLGVSPATVAAAYRDLRMRGVVASRPRRGVHVAFRPPLAGGAAAQVPDGVVDLATGNPDPALLPPLPLLDPPDRPRLYGQQPNLSTLLDVARRDLAPDGIATDHLAVTSGALDGIDRILDVHVRPGDRVAVEDPCWTGTRDLLRVRGFEAVGVEVDERGMVPDALARALRSRVQVVLVTPRAHNPTGAALDELRATELRRVLATDPDALVIEDDHAGDVGGAAHHTLTAGRQRWAVVRSVAKALGPDLRLALLAGDRFTVSRVEGRQLLGPGWVSTILQRVVVAMLTDPATRSILHDATAIYARRRTALLAALTAAGVDATGRSGMNVWVRVHEEAPLVAGLLRAGWAVRAGEPFRLATEPGLRITTAALATGDAARLAGDLAALLDGSNRTRLG
jgi:DNA-binding transcriptional MocR family regulator